LISVFYDEHENESLPAKKIIMHFFKDSFLQQKDTKDWM
jgi:hypothetical protein